MPKSLLSLLAAMVFSLPSFAQLSDGCIAPDWTATDINGNEWNMQSLLDQGKTVILHFDAAWNSAGWSYLSSGVLPQMYETFGPNGTDDLMVFLLESDPNTTFLDLQGLGENSAGDWVSATPYPIIDNAGAIFDNFENAYYPTVYTICPDGTLTQSGQASFDTHVDIAFSGCAEVEECIQSPDWTATDIDGNQYNLYSYLDAGKTVILHFDAAWNGPGWNYLNSGVLPQMYETFGPNGTDDLMVFLVEVDETTTLSDLQGFGDFTQGDWVSSTPYPIIDNAFLGNLFDVASVPQIVTICPDRCMTVTDQASFEDHVGFAFSSCCNSIDAPAPLISSNTLTIACGNNPWTASTEVVNWGDQPMTSAEFEVTWNGNTESWMYNGYLAPGASQTVTFGEYVGAGELGIALAEVNGQSWSALETILIEPSVPSTPEVLIQITTDNWPDETGWSITNEQGIEVASSPIGALTGSPNTTFSWPVTLAPEGCYELTFYDLYGDGLFASQWGNFADGTIDVYAMNEEGVGVSIVWQYDGASGAMFSETTVGIKVINAAIGCTNELACNYNEEAVFEDGSCLFPGILCDDGNVNTINDLVGEDCTCSGTPATVFDIIAGSDEHNLLEDAVLAAGLEGALGGPGPFTVFAPTDAAITDAVNTLGITASDLLALPNLADILNYHVVADSIVSGDLIEGAMATTVYGADVAFSLVGGPMVNEANIGPADISATNGVVHVIDAVLLTFGCTDEAACNYDPFALFDDGSCLMLDGCGVCGGPGEIYECGCADIPEGDCDCDGNQLDALGDCGGPCDADVDSDGICDDIDPCVGELDACGVCNGPGEIYECGCSDIPAGDCDCDGNQLDALGVCGGDCAEDANGNGVCDDAEIVGCMNAAACNYNADATESDGSCLFPGDPCNDGNDDTLNDMYNDSCECEGTLPVVGCINPNACNYDPDAVESDGSCLFPGDPCDDEDTSTVNDAYNDACECEGEVESSVTDTQIDVALYPNPVRDWLQIHLENDMTASLILFDPTGRVVQTWNAIGSTRLDLQHLPSGQYLLAIHPQFGPIRSERISILAWD